MIVAVISDIHANLEALKRVLDDAKSNGAERIVCLGDVVGYGPLPKETLDLVRERASLVVAGNHDDAVSGRADAASFIDLAADAVRRHREALGADDLKWLKSLPYSGAVGEAIFTHGDFVDPAKFYYIENDKDALASFNATDAKLMFVGHTHVPGIFLTGRSGTVYATAPQDFTLEAGKRYIVNPGSVGYPRESNGQCYSSYVLYDTKERTVSFRFLPFAVASVMQRGRGSATGLRSIMGLVAIIAASLAVICILASRSPEPEVVTVVADKEDALAIARKTLPLNSTSKSVRANLVLGRGSPAVSLKTEFFNSRDEVIKTSTDPVSQSKNRRLPVPAAAKSVTFTVYKLKESDNPAITRFDPTID